MSEPLLKPEQHSLPVLRPLAESDDGKTLSSALWILSVISRLPVLKIERRKMTAMCALSIRLMDLGLNYLTRGGYVKVVAAEDASGRLNGSFYCFDLQGGAARFPNRGSVEFFKSG